MLVLSVADPVQAHAEPPRKVKKRRQLPSHTSKQKGRAGGKWQPSRQNSRLTSADAIGAMEVGGEVAADEEGEVDDARVGELAQAVDELSAVTEQSPETL